MVTVQITHFKDGSIGTVPCPMYEGCSYKTCECRYMAGNAKPHYPVPAIANLMPLVHPVVLYGSTIGLWATSK